jgi:hypothetical protein
MDKAVDKSFAIKAKLNSKLYFEQSIFAMDLMTKKDVKSNGQVLIMDNAPQSLKDELSHLEIIYQMMKTESLKHLLKNNFTPKAPSKN